MMTLQESFQNIDMPTSEDIPDKCTKNNSRIGQNIDDDLQFVVSGIISIKIHLFSFYNSNLDFFFRDYENPHVATFNTRIYLEFGFDIDCQK